MDGGLAGDEWKAYARSTGKVWYYGASNLDDVIAVDFVTEPGLLTDHHVISRLTNNAGTFTFALDVRLDFGATDAGGNLIWDPADVLAPVGSLRTLTPGQRRDALETLADSVTQLNGGLLPPEGDFLAIIIDALNGNDVVTIGPTVQKTVWVDAGAGDDRVEIKSGNAILIDAADGAGSLPVRGEGGGGGSSGSVRNDTPEQAFDLTSVLTPLTPALSPADGGEGAGIANSVTFRGLSIDSPSDEDWYRFRLAAASQAGDFLSVASLSAADGIMLELRNEDGDLLGVSASDGRIALAGAGGTPALQLAAATPYLLHVVTNRVPTIYELTVSLLATPDAAETAGGNADNDAQARSIELTELDQLDRVTGLSLDSSADVDWFQFTLHDGGTANDAVSIDQLDGAGTLTVALFDAAGQSLTTSATAASNATFRLAGRSAGDYWLQVSTVTASNARMRYELAPRIGSSDFERLDFAGGTVVSLSTATPVVRRDVLLGAVKK
jgi:hypothetical protein